MPTKKLRSRKIANGNPKATWNSTTPAIEPNIPKNPYSLAIGMSAIWIGTTSSAITTRNNPSRYGKSIHANAYAASAEIPMTSSVAGTVMKIVFQNDELNPDASRFE
jgi:hypothetical protein